MAVYGDGNLQRIGHRPARRRQQRRTGPLGYRPATSDYVSLYGVSLCRDHACRRETPIYVGPMSLHITVVQVHIGPLQTDMGPMSPDITPLGIDISPMSVHSPRREFTSA